MLPGQAGDRKDPPGTVQAPPPESLDIPPAPALDPGAELDAFEVAAGYRVELVAAEPLIESPVAIAFDAHDRMWVVEMRGYMRDPDATAEDAPTGRIAVLEDVDGDGRMDRRTTFLDHLKLPRGVLPLGDGALVLEPPGFAFWRDTDGDGEADQRDDLGRAFDDGLANPEHAANTPRLGLDNWIAFADHGAGVRRTAGGWDWQPVPAAGQWGLGFDDFGNAYFDTNSDQLRGHLAPACYAARNPELAHPAFVNQRIAPDQTVWPARVTPGVNRGYQRGVLRADGTLARFTAACAPCVYRGDAMPELAGDVFVAEPAAQLVRRDVLASDGTRVTASNAYAGEHREFLASHDERFRPVGLENGPDGALYVVDMYRGLIQHRNFLTSYLRKQVEARGLATPIDRGRIWRVVRVDAKRRAPRPLAACSGAELVVALHDGNGFTRDTAQRLLVERGDRGVVPALVELARHGDATLPRVHALWTLEGLGALDRSTVLVVLRDRDDALRAQAVRLAEPWLRSGDLIVTGVLARLAADATSPRLRLQLALSLGEAAPAPADVRAAVDDALLAVLDRDGDDPRALDAAISGLAQREAAFAHRLASRDGPPTDGRLAALARLAECAFRGRRPADLEAVLDAATTTGARRRRALLDGVLRALPAKGAHAIRVPAPPLALAALAALDDADVHAAVTRIRAALAVGAAAPMTAAGVAVLPGAARGRMLYRSLCAACHQSDGAGMDGLAPPLHGSEWVLGPPDRLIRIGTERGGRPDRGRGPYLRTPGHARPSPGPRRPDRRHPVVPANRVGPRGRADRPAAGRPHPGRGLRPRHAVDRARAARGPLTRASRAGQVASRACRSAFGAVLRHASASAWRTDATRARRSVTSVAPRAPHAPDAGRNTAGSASRWSACCAGVSLTMPQSPSGPSVAKILPRTRKSGWRMCADSVASGSSRARARKRPAFIASLERARELGDGACERACRSGDEATLRGRGRRTAADHVHLGREDVLPPIVTAIPPDSTMPSGFALGS